MRFLLIFISITLCNATNAEMYKCVDESGKVSFSDEKCKENSENSHVVEQKINILPFRDEVELEKNKLKTIYSGSIVGQHSRFLRVSIYEETDSYMIFYVEGFYEGPSSGRAEFRVMPNIHWGARSFSTSDRGVSSGYARIGLGSKEKDIAISDVITLQLWYYSPENKASILETKVIPFKKRWVKDT